MRCPKCGLEMIPFGERTRLKEPLWFALRKWECMCGYEEKVR